MVLVGRKEGLRGTAERDFPEFGSKREEIDDDTTFTFIVYYTALPMQ